jgi:iron complex outermembrane receptor protein
MAIALSQLAGQTVIRGIVKDATTGDPIDYASISVPGTSSFTHSNFEGAFELKIVTPLPCSLRVSLIGYKEVLLTVTNEKKINIYLEEEIFQLSDIDVVESRLLEEEKKDPQSRVSYDRLAILANPTSEVMSGLGTQPGLITSSPSLAFKVLNTRGFNSAAPVRMLQIIDGVDNQSPGLNFSLGNFLGVSELDLLRVDVIVGASGPFYGPNAFNGVISMKTMDPFIHKGLNVSIKAAERNLLEGGLRYADAFQNRNGDDWLAFKLNLYGLKARDWEADNYDPITASPVDQFNPGRYNAVNIYGDEYSLDVTQFPYDYPGLGHFYRTGYKETDLVDYGTYNLKGNLGFHFRLQPQKGVASPEIVASAATSKGTTVFQGDNRFSLRDIQFSQYRLELRKADKYFLRSYYTHENARNSYDPFFTALKLLQSSKDNRTWSNDYTRYWQSVIISRIPPGNSDWLNEHQDSLRIWHEETAAYADQKHLYNPTWTQDKLIPGTESFQKAFEDITQRLNNEEAGTKFYDKSSLFHVQGEYVWSPRFLMDLTIGGNYRLYMPDSKGTIFHDTAGTRIINHETGWYVGARKGLLKDQKLVLTATLRVDKNKNFSWIQTPALSLVYEPLKETFLRVSFSSALRNPTLSDQYMYLNVGPATLAGHIGQVDSLITLASFDEFRHTLMLNKLVYFNIPALRPEKVKSIDIGVRSQLGKRIYIDAGYFRNWYRDFLGYLLGITSDFEPPPFPIPFNTIVYRYSANSESQVTTEGFTAGVNYYPSPVLSISGNYSYNLLRKTVADDPIIPAFNTPRHMYNIGVSVSSIQNFKARWIKNISCSANYKWVEGYQFEGSPQFTGFIPSYGIVDAQVSYHLKQHHTTIKVGASNILDNRHYETYGGPAIGRMAYVQVRYDLNRNH